MTGCGAPVDPRDGGGEGVGGRLGTTVADGIGGLGGGGGGCPGGGGRTTTRGGNTIGGGTTTTDGGATTGAGVTGGEAIGGGGMRMLSRPRSAKSASH